MQAKLFAMVLIGMAATLGVQGAADFLAPAAPPLTANACPMPAAPRTEPPVAALRTEPPAAAPAPPADGGGPTPAPEPDPDTLVDEDDPDACMVACRSEKLMPVVFELAEACEASTSGEAMRAWFERLPADGRGLLGDAAHDGIESFCFWTVLVMISLDQVDPQLWAAMVEIMTPPT